MFRSTGHVWTLVALLIVGVLTRNTLLASSNVDDTSQLAQAAGAGGNGTKKVCRPGHTYYIDVSKGGSILIYDSAAMISRNTTSYGIVLVRVAPNGPWKIEERCVPGEIIEAVANRGIQFAQKAETESLGPSTPSQGGGAPAAKASADPEISHILDSSYYTSSITTASYKSGEEDINKVINDFIKESSAPTTPVKPTGDAWRDLEVPNTDTKYVTDQEATRPAVKYDPENASAVPMYPSVTGFGVTQTPDTPNLVGPEAGSPVVDPSTHLYYGEATARVGGFSEFCAENPNQCAPQYASNDFQQKSSEERSAELARVQSEVNQGIRAAPVFGGLTQLQPMSVWPAEGDCKSYAATKQEELISSGWPSSQVQLATVQAPNYEYHMVVMVTDDKTGNITILDNMQRYPVPLNQTNYMSWYAIQSPTDPQQWRVVNRYR